MQRLSACEGHARAEGARPKDLGTLDGSRGGLIIPRRVKAAPRRPESCEVHAEDVHAIRWQLGEADVAVEPYGPLVGGPDKQVYSA